MEKERAAHQQKQLSEEDEQLSAEFNTAPYLDSSRHSEANAAAIMEFNKNELGNNDVNDGAKTTLL